MGRIRLAIARAVVRLLGPALEEREVGRVTSAAAQDTVNASRAFDLAARQFEARLRSRYELGPAPRGRR